MIGDAKCQSEREPTNQPTCLPAYLRSAFSFSTLSYTSPLPSPGLSLMRLVRSVYPFALVLESLKHMQTS